MARSKPSSRGQSIHYVREQKGKTPRAKSLWRPCGRNLQFTLAFNNNMFIDSTIEGATREREKMSRTLQRMKAREEKQLARLELLQRKLEIAAQLENELGGKFMLSGS